MTNRLDDTVGSVEYDGLIYSGSPKPDVFSVTVRKGSEGAILKRGTVLALSTGAAGDGKMVVLGKTAAGNETLAASCILADDITVGATADVTATAYRTGNFNRNKLIVAEGYAIKASDGEDLRKGGIILDTAV